MKGEVKAPKGETLWVEYRDRTGKARFIITSKQIRDWYFLYECTEDGLKKLGKAKTPPELEKKFEIQKKMKS